MYTTIKMLIVLLFSATVLFAQPQLEIVGGDIQDWGKVDLKDSPLKKVIELKNVGSETLKITNVKPTCGCTTAPLDKDELAPGESAKLDVSLRVSHGGKVSKSIRVSSNDSQQPNKIIMLKADVFEAVSVTPKYLPFRNMQVGESAVAVTTVTNNTDKPIMIKNIKLDPEDLKIDLPANTVLEPHVPLAIKVNYIPKETGRLRANLILETNNEENKTIRITGFGQIKP